MRRLWILSLGQGGCVAEGTIQSAAQPMAAQGAKQAVVRTNHCGAQSVSVDGTDKPPEESEWWCWREFHREDQIGESAMKQEFPNSIVATIVAQNPRRLFI